MSAAPNGEPATPTVAERVGRADWRELSRELDDHGFAVIPSLLSVDECAQLAGMYSRPEAFRSRVIMSRHGFGRGEYQYFNYPLPSIVQSLRETLYERLALVANRWQEWLGNQMRFPAHHQAYLDRCHAAGQTRPTALLLKYSEDDYNCLHQDLYGDEVFPLQVAALLSSPERDFSGGEFIITEQRPRMQSRASVVPLTRGDAAIFAVNERPVRGTRGFYRVKLRHGVSRIRSGQRFTAGIIFHNAH